MSSFVDWWNNSHFKTIDFEITPWKNEQVGWDQILVMIDAATKANEEKRKQEEEYQNSSKLWFTVGPTRAGKSTFAKQWKKDWPAGIVIDSDFIRLALHGERYNHHTEPITFGIESIVIKSFLLQGYKVLFCETNTSAESIKKILRIDKTAKPIYIAATPEQCYERARATNQEDLIEYGVIDRHFNNLKSLLFVYGGTEISQKGIDEAVDTLRNKF